jgi:hypothetical protein
MMIANLGASVFVFVLGLVACFRGGRTFLARKPR